MVDDSLIFKAVANTRILRPPKQRLATFGITNIDYYLLTTSSYPVEEGDMPLQAETVVREGKVIVQQPRIVTPYYLTRLEGFSDEAKRYFSLLVDQYGSQAPGLMYAYKNESKGLNIVPGELHTVAQNISQQLDKDKAKLTTIIQGEDTLWDVSLLKFIYDLTRHSLQGNLSDLGSRGRLGVGTDGVPSDARFYIEELFSKTLRDEADPSELKDELERWELFNEYQDRFFALFKKK